MRGASSPATTIATRHGRKSWRKPRRQFLASLTGASAAADLLPRAMPLESTARRNNQHRRDECALADFVAEGAPIPVVNGASSNVASLSPGKFAVITVLTREIIESRMLRRSCAMRCCSRSVRRWIDVCLNRLRPLIGLGPPGLLHNITPLTAASGSSDDAMKTDLQKLISAVAVVAGIRRSFWFVRQGRPSRSNLRTLGNFDYPVLVSSALADGTIIAIATAALVSATGGSPSDRHDERRRALVWMTAPGAI